MNNIITQYKSIKAKYPDAILLFRVGDFYELFNGDAETASKVLGIELLKGDTSGDVNQSAFVPHYSLDKHLRTLVKAGYRVAVCEELESPKTNKNIRRGVTDIK